MLLPTINSYLTAEFLLAPGAEGQYRKSVSRASQEREKASHGMRVVPHVQLLILLARRSGGWTQSDRQIAEAGAYCSVIIAIGIRGHKKLGERTHKGLNTSAAQVSVRILAATA